MSESGKKERQGMVPVDGSKNGYFLGPDTTNEEFKRILMSRSPIRCIIMNFKTRERFRVRLLGRDITTVNNKVPDDCIYINRFS